MMRRSFLPLLKKAGLPRIRFHDLRHSAATLLLGQSVHPKVVAEMLGHQRLVLTVDAVRRIEALWGGERASGRGGPLPVAVEG